MSIIYDAHACPPFAPNKDLSGLARYKASGVNFVSVNVGYGDMSLEEVLSIIHRFRDFIQINSNEYFLVTTAKDIEHCKQTKKLGVAFDLEGVNSLENHIDMLDTYKKLGVKQMLLAYNKNNYAAGGCLDNDTGLTTIGARIIRKMNESGIVVDCSHAGIKTTFDIFTLSAQPVVFSHANPMGMHKHPRNITDEQIKGCAETGGVIGINGISIFLGSKEPTVSLVADHIEYVTQLVGSSHVGIGLDYILDHDEVKAAVKASPHLFPHEQHFTNVELLIPEQIPAILNELTNRGYKAHEIQAIMGGNFMRVVKQVWGE
ncbi:MAG: hypothetical protein A3E85_06005 [Gammaproteobacteria bacterium RIFCSPHIGHO2_12_FULL_45_12]|nr:MAG: hypothetical protein A3E85_06005 [Gammaproteobacteria bacterium RIFCSPHIGHO2_12_FULL_45_12]